MPQIKFKNYVNSEHQARVRSFWKSLLKHRLFRLGLGAVAGALLGWLYWKFVGCHSGSCPLTSSPIKTVILFSFMGGLFARNKQTEQDAAN